MSSDRVVIVVTNPETGREFLFRSAFGQDRPEGPSVGSRLWAVAVCGSIARSTDYDFRVVDVSDAPDLPAYEIKPRMSTIPL